SIFLFILCFLFTASSPPATYTLSLHDALPISAPILPWGPFTTQSCELHPLRCLVIRLIIFVVSFDIYNTYLFSIYYEEWWSFYRSEEHTSELQSRFDLVCRLLLEKKKNQ